MVRGTGGKVVHDTPPTCANVNIMSYADDFTITYTHNILTATTTKLPKHTTDLNQHEPTKIAPTKSTITLLAKYRKEQQTLDNTVIPHKHSTKILGVTYNTLSFKDHNNKNNIVVFCKL